MSSRRSSYESDAHFSSSYSDSEYEVESVQDIRINSGGRVSYFSVLFVVVLPKIILL